MGIGTGLVKESGTIAAEFFVWIVPEGRNVYPSYLCGRKKWGEGEGRGGVASVWARVIVRTQVLVDISVARYVIVGTQVLVCLCKDMAMVFLLTNTHT